MKTVEKTLKIGTTKIKKNGSDYPKYKIIEPTPENRTNIMRITNRF